MCVQICACICNFLYPLSKRNQRLWSLVKAECFMNPGHLNVIEIRQNTKAKTPQQKDSDAHLQEWLEERTCEHPTLETVGDVFEKPISTDGHERGRSRKQHSPLPMEHTRPVILPLLVWWSLREGSWPWRMEPGVHADPAAPSTLSQTPHNRGPGREQGPPWACCQEAVGRHLQSPGRKRHPTASRMAQSCDPKCGAGLPVNHGPGKQRQCGSGRRAAPDF